MHLRLTNFGCQPCHLVPGFTLEFFLDLRVVANCLVGNWCGARDFNHWYFVPAWSHQLAFRSLTVEASPRICPSDFSTNSSKFLGKVGSRFLNFLPIHLSNWWHFQCRRVIFYWEMIFSPTRSARYLGILIHFLRHGLPEGCVGFYLLFSKSHIWVFIGHFGWQNLRFLSFWAL